jgi:hypothetical protein
MPKGPTKAELEERNERLSRENSALTFVLSLRSLGRTPDATETIYGAEGHWTRLELWGATRANGGFLIHVEGDPNYLPLVTGSDFDSLAAKLRANTLIETLDVRAAVSRLEARRNALMMADVRPLGEGA